MHVRNLVFSVASSPTHLIFVSSAVPAIDTSGIAFLIDLKKPTEKLGLEVYILLIFLVHRYQFSYVAN